MFNGKAFSHPFSLVTSNPQNVISLNSMPYAIYLRDFLVEYCLGPHITFLLIIFFLYVTYFLVQYKKSANYLKVCVMGSLTDGSQ